MLAALLALLPALPLPNDPEVGANDFPVSAMGGFGSTTHGAWFPAVAYNPTANEYFVVWHGNDGSPPMGTFELEVFGQRVNAVDGSLVGPPIRISDMGTDGDTSWVPILPDVVYNPTHDEYLVVWNGEDDVSPLVADEREVFVQRIDASTGAEIGVNDRRISDMGAPGDSSVGLDFFAVNFSFGEPAVGYNAVDDEYLVVWAADGESPLVDEEYEIFGQRLDGATAAEVGADDFRISDQGPDGTGEYDGRQPDVAHDPVANRWFVVWSGDDDVGSLVNGELEIFGQFLDAATGSPVGPPELRLTHMGADGDFTSGSAQSPNVVYNPELQEFLVVWSGRITPNRFVGGQRVDAATMTEVGSDDFPISDPTAAWVEQADVAYNPTSGEYLVIWTGEVAATGEREVFGQFLDGQGTEIGEDDFRLSDMGPDGNTSYIPTGAAVAAASVPDEFLVVWHGDDDAPPTVEDELEIRGQRVETDRLVTPTCFGDGTAANACPCGNASVLGAKQGCGNSLAPFDGSDPTTATTGARLAAASGSGLSISAPIGAGGLQLLATQIPPLSSGVFIVTVGGTLPGLTTPYDGILCAGGGPRLNPGLETTPGTRLSGDDFLFGPSLVADGNAQQPGFFVPGTYGFAYWFRDNAPGGSPCGTGANFTHGVEAVLVP